MDYGPYFKDPWRSRRPFMLGHTVLIASGKRYNSNKKGEKEAFRLFYFKSLVRMKITQ
jgi:hypothetical protein